MPWFFRREAMHGLRRGRFRTLPTGGDDAGAAKGPVYALLQEPHFSEGFFGARKWNVSVTPGPFSSARATHTKMVYIKI
ncbi:hypothetical protein [Burkholderia pyrrocinia]|uniref:hypothetical protein n=1 Tax=Burkholderia pyrrocinia TaxID=60550 RepID=UPI001589EB53|nr:hypothetical protein [Burkholderia pyrrocinia]